MRYKPPKKDPARAEPTLRVPLAFYPMTGDRVNKGRSVSCSVLPSGGDHASKSMGMDLELRDNMKRNNIVVS